MADLKTTLREVSVAVKIYDLVKLKEFIDSSISPLDYYKICKELNIVSDNSIEQIKTFSRFSPDEIDIIKNSFKLAEEIVLKLGNKFSENPKILWHGWDTQKNEPYDLEVDSLKFSLKEDSYILENMGLYKLIYLLTNTSYPRGTHVFRLFSGSELNKWFLFCWEELKGFLKSQNYANSYGNIILNSNNEFEFTVASDTLIINPNSIKSELDFNDNIKSKFREKLFSKFVKDKLEGNENYSYLKSECVKIAGENLVNFIKTKLTLENLPRFLQVYDQGYYYGKSTSNSIELYEVPKLSEFTHNFRIKDIKWEGSTQLNLITILENTKNNNILELRNECRYSHGQLNGTPEAKLYIRRNSTLADIYNKV